MGAFPRKIRVIIPFPTKERSNTHGNNSISTRIPLQALPNVYGTYDYRIFRDILIKIDDVLTRSGLEHNLVSQAFTPSPLKKRKIICQHPGVNKL